MYNGLQLVDVPKEPDPERGWTDFACIAASYENDIKRELANIQQSFLYIGMKLWDIRQQNLYTAAYVSPEGFSGWRTCTNITEYAQEVFDLSPSTTSNLIRVYEVFADKRGFLLPKWEKYTFSQLCELLRFPYIDSSVESMVSPFMTCREIRALNPKSAKKSKPALPVVDTFSSSDSDSIFDVKNENVSEPQTDMVEITIGDIHALRDWFMNLTPETAVFPMTISYKK